MAACVDCGKKAAFMLNRCDECYRKFEDERLSVRRTASVVARPTPSAPPVSAVLRLVDVEGAVTAPGRPEIRAYVANQVAAVKAHAAAGGNPHHLILDHQDQLDKFVAALPAGPVRDDFIRIYTEEFTVATEGLKQEVTAKENAEMYTASKNYTIVASIFGIIAFLFIGFVLRAC